MCIYVRKIDKIRTYVCMYVGFYIYVCTYINAYVYVCICLCSCAITYSHCSDKLAAERPETAVEEARDLAP